MLVSRMLSRILVALFLVFAFSISLVEMPFVHAEAYHQCCCGGKICRCLHGGKMQCGLKGSRATQKSGLKPWDCNSGSSKASVPAYAKEFDLAEAQAPAVMPSFSWSPGPVRATLLIFDQSLEKPPQTFSFV